MMIHILNNIDDNLIKTLKPVDFNKSEKLSEISEREKLKQSQTPQQQTREFRDCETYHPTA
jgi:2-C-methyl-D-erythritol 4-phosphate cytidylyltransferase